MNFFDTANSYQGGTSEEITGRALRDLARRDEIVVATKCFMPWGQGPNQGGLSRKAIFEAVDASLARLGMDHVDLYQIHRWDPKTPIEETMEALHDVVKAGKARDIGASSMFAWQFRKAQGVAERNGWMRFVSINHRNLLYREEEREMLPACRDMGVGVIPWSPIARGRLARPAGTETGRTAKDRFGAMLYRAMEDNDREIVAAVGQVAAGRGVAMAPVALAWVLERPVVTAPILGVTRAEHLADAIAALDLKLSAQERAILEAPYRPHPVAGHQ